MKGSEPSLVKAIRFLKTPAPFLELSRGFKAKLRDGIGNKVQTSNFFKLLRPFPRWPGTIKLGSM